MAQTLGQSLQENITKAEQYLARWHQTPLGHFINGQPTASTGTELFDNLSPVTEERLNQVAAGNAADVDAAAKAAKAAFPAWRDIGGDARRAMLHKVANAIEARREEIAFVECMDTGQPLRFMSAAAARGAENFRFFADRAHTAANGLSLPARDHLNYTTRVPLGPVAVITPWNTPFMLSTWKIAPALAAGCTVVHKPAEWSPLTAMLLAEIITEAGVPPGVINVVNGLGEGAGKLLTEHPSIRATAFIGESKTGSLIMSQGAPTLKRVHLELGGKNPVIVFADADLDRAVDAAVFMIYSLNGERCTSSSRLLIESSIYDHFVELVAARAGKLKVGHPLDVATEIGPLIHKRHFEKVANYFEIAKSEGAQIRAGGIKDSSQTKGYFVKPTLFSGASNTMRIAREEIFGPVLTAIPFKDEDDALCIANDTPYGLAAYLWTNNVGRALRMSSQLEAGMIWVNSENNRHLPTPFGGTKASGIGRDGGDYSFDFYMETKNVCLAQGTHKVPKLAS